MRIRELVVLAGVLGLVASGCGGDDDDGGGGGDKGSIKVGSANFGEAQIIASMYGQVLEDAGFDVTVDLDSGQRESYIPALQKGEINVVPEYIGTLAEYFNAQLNGPDAPTKSPKASGEATETFQNLEGLIDEVGKLQLTPFAENATDQNSFAVTQETADKYGLEKLSDLAKPDVQGQLVLGAGPECETRPFCLVGLENTYGAKFKEAGDKYRKFESSGGQSTINALKDGTVDIGLVFTSDGSVDEAGLIRLEDDKKLQPSDNITSLSQEGTLNEEAQDLIDTVNQTLTTDDLKELNLKFNVEKGDPEDIAKEYLEDKDLI